MHLKRNQSSYTRMVFNNLFVLQILKYKITQEITFISHLSSREEWNNNLSARTETNEEIPP
jgi:hypothetical protein